MNLHTKAAGYMLQLCNMFYEKNKDPNVETAISSLRLVIMNGDCELTLGPLYPEILKFANNQRELLLKRDIGAFEYVPIPSRNLMGNNDKQIFINIIEQSKKIYAELPDKNIFWEKINGLIAVVIKIHTL